MFKALPLNESNNKAILHLAIPLWMLLKSRGHKSNIWEEKGPSFTRGDQTEKPYPPLWSCYQEIRSRIQLMNVTQLLVHTGAIGFRHPRIAKTLFRVFVWQMYKCGTKQLWWSTSLLNRLCKLPLGLLEMTSDSNQRLHAGRQWHSVIYERPVPAQCWMEADTGLSCLWWSHHMKSGEGILLPCSTWG